MELSHAEKIKEIETRLRKAKLEKLKLEQQVSALQSLSADMEDFEIEPPPTQEDDAVNASLIEQLARAHYLLQKALLAEEDSRRHLEKSDMAQIAAFLENLFIELDEDVHTEILERSSELVAEDYGLES
ncbi:hypothetical protein AC578_11140 [Pseudocercospora eumusae]|uniref:Uncharacterized protein n=1 Tax=Pseudocercospora eumusae TaxID=321146 RepID=A0A139H299_9PEZI|nr:hypothetical protein AC578_11140 [Pseudocercospora eumusae]